jgi:hypothetical protein
MRWRIAGLAALAAAAVVIGGCEKKQATPSDAGAARAVVDARTPRPARTAANAGDPCNVDDDVREDAGVCAADRKSLLTCDAATNGKLVVTNRCTGPEGCTVFTIGDVKKPECDRSVASVGEACAKGDENGRSCARDKPDVLVCRGGRYERERTCPPPTICFNGSRGLVEAMCTRGIP